MSPAQAELFAEAGGFPRLPEHRVELQPIARAAFIGPYIQQLLARIWLMAVEPDKADGCPSTRRGDRCTSTPASSGRSAKPESGVV